MASKKNMAPAISFILIIFTIYWSIHSLMPDLITNSSAPETKFSTERALYHLKNITEKPHYTGSEYHEEVRNYIIAQLKEMGLDVSVQTQQGINKKWRSAVVTKNILARIKGTENGKALLILSHYDSSPHSSLGASDAGSGVVTILESVRAFLAAGKKPKNDIIILITDAEELGLLGADAFVNHHPWAKDIGLVLNFEARGSGGPSYLLIETNGGNKQLIEAFKKAKPGHPVSNSLLYSIYKMLPNDTDLTVFREDADIDGLNFAFIDDHYDYHTAQDSFERLDRNTLQQQGEYLLPLMTYLADADLNRLKSETDEVFFNFPGTVLINYPFSWVMPMWALAAFTFLVILFIGFRRKKLTFRGVFYSLGIFLLLIGIAGLLTFYGWELMLYFYPQYKDILHGFTYNGHFYITAFISLVLWIGFWFYNKGLKKKSGQDIIAGPILVWLLINLAVARYLPGAGFLILPVFAALIIFGWLIFSTTSKKQVIWFTLLSLPTLIVLVPLIKMFPVGLGLKMTAVSAVFSILVLGLMIPVFSFYANRKGLTRFFFLIAALSFISAGFTSGYSIDQKQPNSILYVYDTDSGKAYWASYNTSTDVFTRQFLGENPEKGSFLKDVTGSKYGTNYKLYQEAEKYAISEPDIRVLKDTLIDEMRELNITIQPKRKANRVDLISSTTLHFDAFSINEQDLKKPENSSFVFDTKKRKQILSYYFTEKDSILNIQFKIPKKDTLKVTVFESSWDLFTNSVIKKKIIPRDSSMMPMPFVLNDAIVVKKEVDLAFPR